MFDYQKVHEDNIVEEFKHSKIVLDISPAGSGKTRMAASICKKMGYKAFVISPINNKYFWIEEMKIVDINFDIVNPEMFKTGYIFKSDGNRTINFDKQKFKSFEPNTLVIFDEIHICRNETQLREMLNWILTFPIKLLGLSGTIPAKCDFLPSYKTFSAKFEIKFNNNLIWLNQWRDAPRPKFNFKDVQRLELKKIPLYLKYYNERVCDRVILFCAFNETIRRLRMEFNKMGVQTVTINGNNSDIINAKNIKLFQNGEVDIALVNISSGGSSLNLQDTIGRPIQTIMNIVWYAILFIQMLNRIYRVNSMSDCNQYILVTDDPLDKYMCSLLLKSMDKLL